VVIATNETFFASKLSTSLAKSGQPVDLVHHDHIDHLGMQVLEQPLKRRAVQIAAGIGGIIVPRRQHTPALRRLGLYVGLTGLALSIKRIELELEDLDEASLKLILTQPKNALVKQYQQLFKMEGVDLTVAEEALAAMARKGRSTARRGRAGCVPSWRLFSLTLC
jgi:hypothetical protein